MAMDFQHYWAIPFGLGKALDVLIIIFGAILILILNSLVPWLPLIMDL